VLLRQELSMQCIPITLPITAVTQKIRTICQIRIITITTYCFVVIVYFPFVPLNFMIVLSSLAMDEEQQNS